MNAGHCAVCGKWGCDLDYTGADGLSVCDDCRDLDYAEQDEDGQLSIGVTGEQRAIPGLAAPRREHPTFDMGA